MNQRSVCIIGAGPAGLVAAKKFSAKSDLFDISVYEKLSDVGGTWIYTDYTGIDKYGLNVHSSIYQNLKTNLPTALMEFDDYPFNHNPTGFINHRQVLQYLQRFANHFQLHKYIKFLHLVTKIYRRSNSWSVEVCNLETNEIFTRSFDIIAVCQGRFSDPSIPKNIPGLDNFKGTIVHTHVYRRPEDFKYQRVVVLGCGPSGIDIALEVAEVAQATYLCSNPREKHFALGDKIVQYGAIFKSIGTNSIELTNGTVLESIDTIIFATGYHVNLDIFDSSCSIKGGEGRVDGLFMHMINIEYPTMAIIGLIEKLPPLNFFCQMVKYFVGTLTGEAKLPSKDEMIADFLADRKKRQSMNIKLKYSHRMFADQLWEYDRKISKLGGFDCLSPIVKTLLDECAELRYREVDYKKFQFLINPDNTTVSIIKNEETINN